MEKFNKLIIFITIILSLGAFFVQPVYDDFYYLTAPHKPFLYTDLLPNGAFWRPIDALLGGLMGEFPKLFPMLNHALVLIGFAYAIWGLNYILKYCKILESTKTISLAFFCLSPALVATTYSIDSSNQTLSLALGIASVIHYNKHKTFSYILMILALFSKESGIAWFVVTPVLNLIIESYKTNKILKIASLRTLAKPLGISLGILLIYATLRLTLNVHVDSPVDSSSRYTGGIGINSITGLGILLTLAASNIDTVAIFIERNWYVFIITCLTTILNIVCIGKKIAKSNVIIFFILFFSIIAVSSPHVVMKHPGEMHVYPTLWMISLSIGILANKVNWTKKEYYCILTYVIIGIFVFVHKSFYIYKNGEIAHLRVMSAVQQTKCIPQNILILDCDKQKKAYSVFQIDGKRCWDSGKGTRLNFDLKNPQNIEYHIITDKDINKYIAYYKNTKKKFDVCWIVKNNKVNVIK